MRGNKWIAVLAAVVGMGLCGVIIWAVGGLNSYEQIPDAAVISKTAEDQSGTETVTVPEHSEESGETSQKEIQSVTETELQTEPQQTSLNIMFAGDVLLSGHVTNAYDKAGRIQGVVDQKLLDAIEQADIFMVNEEFPFSERGEAAADKQFTFRLSPDRVHMIREMGIDIVTLANNHALDFGRDALLDTCETLDNAGILYVGAGENLDRAKQLITMEAGGKTIGFLGASRVIPESGWTANSYTPGMLTTYDPAILLSEIQKARESCDYVIVYVHWGIEKAETPEAYQRTLGQQYIDAGADLVVGSHPHVLQGIEYYKGRPIVYSLGNFVFGSSIPRTMLLNAEFSDEGMKLSVIPATSSGGHTKAVTGEEAEQEFYTYLESISYGASVTEGTVVPDKAQP